MGWVGWGGVRAGGDVMRLVVMMVCGRGMRVDVWCGCVVRVFGGEGVCVCGEGV